MSALLVAFVVVFFAEFGDKTEVLTLAVAVRYGVLPVLAGVSLTTALINAVSVTVGTAVAQVIPTRVVTVISGVAFLGFADWSGRAGSSAPGVGGDHRSAVVVGRFAVLFAPSEVGDKTMLATVALAAHGHAMLVWTGSTLGIVAAEAVTVLVGSRVGGRLSQGKVRVVSASLFAGMGVILLVGAGLR